MKKSYKNDILDGLYEEYFENGQVKIKGFYLNGNLNGVWTKYFEDGKVKSIQEYDKNTGSIIINEMSNPNVNYNCSNSFLGKWTFNKNGSRGIGFYKSSNCGFFR